MPVSYSGATTSRGMQLWRARPCHNITIDGLEVTSDASTDPYALIWIYAGHGPGTETTGVQIRRSWIHGRDDQESYPHVGVLMSASDSEVSDSIIEHIYSRIGDTQAIGISQSPGHLLIENNFLNSTGQSVMSGGNFPNYMGRTTRNIILRRNHSWKPKKWFTGIQAARIDTTGFRLRSAGTSQSCGTVASSVELSNRCFWYYNDVRYELLQDAEFRLTGGSTSGFGYLYGLAGQLYFRHNLTTGTWTCPTSVDCAYSANPTLPPGAPRLAKAVVNNGTFDGNFYIEATSAWHKNHYESKEGNGWLIEGNVMEQQWIVNGSIHQNMCINITNAPSGSGLGPLNYLVSSNEFLIRYNICRHAAEGFIVNGQSFDTTRKEANGMGQSKGGRVHDNLLYDIGSKLYTNSSIGDAFRTQNSSHWTWEHNTVVDVRQAVNGNSHATLPCCRNMTHQFLSNVFIPWLGTDLTAGSLELPQVKGDGYVDWIQGLGSAYKAFDAATSRFGRNMLMNRNGVTYHSQRGVDYPNTPDKTYLVQPNDPDRNPATLFESYSERNYAASNYRIKASEVSKYPTYTGRAIGADIDEIEALIGVHGADVVAGIPPFHVRSDRRIVPDTTSAVILYRPLTGDSCRITIWSADTYAASAQVTTGTDAAAEVISGMRAHRITGLTPDTDYFGKRWCGTAVDVFRFTTLATKPPSALRLKAPAGAADAVIEWGTSAGLGNITSPVACLAGSTCAVEVPPTATHYRHAFRAANGAVISRGDLRVN
jgi:hypothetical protein